MTSYTKRGLRMSPMAGVLRPSLPPCCPPVVTAWYGGFVSLNLLVGRGSSMMPRVAGKVRVVVVQASIPEDLHASRAFLGLPSGVCPPRPSVVASLPQHAGLPLAVSALNRLPFLLQAIIRRCLAILCSFYFDDATAQDFDFTASSSQSMIEECVALLGYAFAETKRQTPSPQGDFLGIVHDLQDSLRHSSIPLWIRPRLIDKIHDLMDTAEAYNSLPPGLASISCLVALAFLTKVPSGKLPELASELSANGSTLTIGHIYWTKLCVKLFSQSALFWLPDLSGWSQSFPLQHRACVPLQARCLSSCFGAMA